jgi:GDP-L-fucose synthase
MKELAEMISKETSRQGRIEFDSSKPDGALRELSNVDKIHSLGWKATMQLREGLLNIIGC